MAQRITTACDTRNLALGTAREHTHTHTRLPLKGLWHAKPPRNLIVSGCRSLFRVQALGLAQVKEQGLSKKPKLFWIGTAVFAVGAIFNFVAFGFAPAASERAAAFTAS